MPTLEEGLDRSSSKRSSRELPKKVRLAVDTKDKATKVACADVLKCGVQQSCYRLKKQYFDGVPAHEVRTTSPISNITDEDWRKLVQKWYDPKNKKEKYKDKEPDAVDIFKQCHNSKKKGFSEPIKQAIANMEAMMEEPVQDGEQPRSSIDVVSNVITQSSATSTFLKNIGLESRSKNSSSARYFCEQLDSERQESAALRQTIEAQQQDIDRLHKHAQDADEARNKQKQEMEEVVKKHQQDMEQVMKQPESGAILNRLLSLSQVQSSL